MVAVRTSTLAFGVFLTFSAMAVASPVAMPEGTSAAIKTHIATGDIQFLDASTLVIQQTSPYAGRHMTFIMRPSTDRRGELKVGSTVSVRYQDTADHRIAMVVEVDHAR